MRDRGAGRPGWAKITLALALFGCHTDDAPGILPEVRSVPHDVHLATGRLDIPLRRGARGGPIVDAVVDGAASVALTFDVAASVVGLHRSTIDRIGLVADHRQMFVRGSAAGIALNVRMGTIETLTLGTNADVRLRNVTWIEANAGEMDGVLPLAALEPLTVTLDGPKSRVVLSHDPLPESGDGAVAPYRLHEGVPFVQLDVGGVPVEARLDTGSNAEFKLNPEVAARLSFTSEPAQFGWVKDVHETRRVEVRRLAGAVRLGAVVTDRPQILVDAGPPAVGAVVLSRCVLTFDTVNHRLRVVP